jgi:hypothetical protein
MNQGIISVRNPNKLATGHWQTAEEVRYPRMPNKPVAFAGGKKRKNLFPVQTDRTANMKKNYNS